MPTPRTLVAAALLLLLCVTSAPAARGEVAVTPQTDAVVIPQQINYQGKLTDNAGNPISGSRNMTFALFDELSGSHPAFWSEGPVSVPVTDGIFNWTLGSSTPITSIPEAGVCYVQITVEGEIITPRQRVVSAGYSYYAKKASDIDDNAVTTAKIANANVTLPKLSPAGASNNQAIIYTTSGGIAWGSIAPGPGSNDYIQNQTAVAQSASWRIAGSGSAALASAVAAPLFGANTDASGTGVVGAGNNVTGTILTTGSGGAFAGLVGAFGTSASATGYGVLARNTNASGTGILGAGNNLAGTYLTTGSGGAFAGLVGAFGTSASATGYGMLARNTSTGGTGIVGAGNNLAGTYLTTGSGGAFSGRIGAYGTSANDTGNGLYGRNTGSNGTAVFGLGNNLVSGYRLLSGGGGAFTGANTGVAGFSINPGLVNWPSSGLYGDGGAQDAFGVMGIGNNSSSMWYSDSAGNNFNGKWFGLEAFADTWRSNQHRAGGAFYALNNPGDTLYVTYITEFNGVDRPCFSVIGRGKLATIEDTKDGPKALFAATMPEARVEDVGRGQLTAGHARVNFSSLYADCIAVTDETPGDVFVQLLDNCNGVYVRPDAAGFDVYELNGGTSNARFSYRVLASSRSGKSARFPAAPQSPTARRGRVDQTRSTSSAPAAEVRQGVVTEPVKSVEIGK